MDLRTVKTRKSIAAAFLQLRGKKPLERITVKELAELALISKATFYLHYKDIFDLSEQLQNEVIQRILASVEHPEHFLTDIPSFTRQLFHAFHAEQSQIEILFSGMQRSVLPMRLEQEFLAFMRRRYPDMDRKTEMLLTYNIQGSHAVYQRYHRECEAEDIIRLVCAVSKATSSC